MEGSLNREIWKLSAKDINSLYVKKEINPSEVAKNILERIQEKSEVINAFVYINKHATLESARLSDERWKNNNPISILDGIPVSVKDLLLTKNWPTLRGSKSIDANLEWNEDAPL